MTNINYLPESAAREASIVLAVAAFAVGAATLSLAVIAAIGGDSSYLVTAGLLAVCTALLASNAWVTVTVTDERLTVHSTLFRIRWKSIDWDDVELALPVDLRPLHWGGWGFRLVSGRSGIILRSGPGIELHLRSGRAFDLSSRHADDLLAAAEGAGVRVEP